MKIKTQFTLAMLLFGAILIALSASVIYTNRQVDAAGQGVSDAEREPRLAGSEAAGGCRGRGWPKCTNAVLCGQGLSAVRLWF